jgi:hypothetical protein
VQWHDCNVRQEHAGPAEEAGEDDPGGPGRPEQGVLVSLTCYLTI